MTESICLIKYVLYSILLFYFSLYKMPFCGVKGDSENSEEFSLGVGE